MLDGEGLWARYPDPQRVIDELLTSARPPTTPTRSIAALQKIYAEPVSVDLLTEAIRTLRDGGGTAPIRLSPQNASSLAGPAIAAGVEMLIIQGTIVSAEHVQANGSALNLKSFIADLDVPVIVGGCTNYQTATHLMRTGAAGVIVGTGHGRTTTTDDVLGIAVPMATAIADAAAARRSYLDETGGRYVHVIAAGGIDTSADIAKAIACGADAVMFGEPLTWAAEAPAGGLVLADHRRPPGAAARVRRAVWAGGCAVAAVADGPALGADGRTNLFGALRRAMAKAGYSDLKEFQKVGLSVHA